jgi:GNAT superfamily N-acetyltransferase
MRPEEAGLCEAILRALPDWFGLEQSIVQYRRDLEDMETYVAEFDGTVAAFLTLAQHNPHTAEIHVMAVQQKYHRHGLGRALVVHAEHLLEQRATSYLEVKTLGPSRPDEHNSQTYAFYIAMGFCPVEENKLWGEDNPCLIMIKHLPCHRGAS